MERFVSPLLAALTALAITGVVLLLLRGAIVNWAVDRSLTRLLKDPYSANLWELAVGLTRVPPHILFELEQRAETGKTLQRPLGTVRRLPDFAGISFSPAQLLPPPRGPLASVAMRTVIAPGAGRPLVLDMPVMVGALGYGVAISENFAVALARGASAAGTAYCAGAGPVLDAVLAETRRLILQYSGGAWNRDRDVLARADMIEIRLGHAARNAAGQVISAADLPARARRMMGVGPDGSAILEAPVPGAAAPGELRQLVPDLRQLIGGGPIGVKLAATHDLERELDAVLTAGVDVIAIDGAQGGTHSAPPILADDFGIPSVYALHRAIQFLERTGARRAVSLVISGGLRTPGEILKALALGADAVYVGTAALMAATHGQLSRTLPFEPISQIVWASSPKARKFNTDQGARALANFLQSVNAELADAIRALGKNSVHDVSRADLVALDRETATILKLPPGWLPPGSRLEFASAADVDRNTE